LALRNIDGIVAAEVDTNFSTDRPRPRTAGEVMHPGYFVAVADNPTDLDNTVQTALALLNFEHREHHA